MEIRRVLILLGALAFLPASVVGQTPGRDWNARVTWAASAFSLDEGRDRDWRPSMGLSLQAGVGTHLVVEVAATGPLSTQEGTVCRDAPRQCQPRAHRPGFTVLTGALAVRTVLGRLRPFIGVGGGRIWVDDRGRRGVWLLSAGADYHLAGPFSAGASLRSTRVQWSFREVGVNHELSLRLSADLLGAE